MPSFQDGALIFLLALLLFGPKKLPELARYVGKLMAEFRRASSEFRMQMEDEFRIAEQAEQQKKIAAMEAAAPVTPPIEPEPEPHSPPPADILAASALEPPMEVGAPEPALSSSKDLASETSVEATEEPRSPATEPLPIASNGDLHLMPPATGLPVARSEARSESLAGVFDSIPQASEPPHDPSPQEPEAPTHA
jgi:sec-independent protein translocase protein TatB